MWHYKSTLFKNSKKAQDILVKDFGSPLHFEFTLFVPDFAPPWLFPSSFGRKKHKEELHSFH
jgi:hypothetical protein